MASAFDWLSFLWEYSREILADVDERVHEDGPAEDTVPPEVRASGWLGYPGATEAQIAAAEARLGVTLPPSYRAFLRVSNGWRPAGGSRGLWSTEEIEWYAVEHQPIDRWEEAPDEVPDELYFDYGPDQDPIYVRLEYLQDALQIGPEDEWGDVEVLIPRVVTADGEWQAWNKGRDLPGAYRSRSFREMLAGNDPGVHQQRVLDHPVWPNKTVEAYLAALDDADSRVRRQAVVALDVYGDRRAVEPLLRVAGTDASLAVRAAAARALSGGFNEVRAIVPLLDTVLHDAHSDRTAIHDAIIPALTYLTNPYWHNPRVPLPASSIPLLIEAVAPGSPGVRSWVRSRSWAATALRYVAAPNDRVIAALAAAQQDNDEEVRRAAEESLRVLSTKG